MAVYFADSSSLAKRYVSEAGSGWIRALLEVNAGYVAAGHNAITLLSSDTELNAAASIEGLNVEDPNTHP